MAISVIHCPSCGSNIHYVIKYQAFVCGSCLSRYTPDELEKKEVNTDAVWEEMKRQTEEAADPSVAEPGEAGFDAAHVAGFSCPNCAAEIVTDPSEATAFCFYCHSHITLTEKLVAEAEAPKRILPFQVTRAEAGAIFNKMLKRKKFLPKTFLANLKTDLFSSVYVPFFLYDAKADGAMNAEAKRVTSWSDSKYIYTKTDTYEVRRVGGLFMEQLPIDASEKMDDTTMRNLEPYDHAGLQPFNTVYLSGHMAQIPDTGREKLLATFHGLVRPVLEQQLLGSVHGYTSTRVLSCSYAAENVSREYVLYPVWVLSAKHKGRDYLCTVNGQTGKTAGKLPVSAAQVFKWMGLFFLIGTVGAFVAQEVMAWIG